MALLDPDDETLVRKPGSCPLVMFAAPALTSLTEGEVSRFHRVTVWPPLLTTCGTPLLKYDCPHQHRPIETTPTIPLFVALKPPKAAWFRRNRLPSLPAAAARLGMGPAWGGNNRTPPEP